MIKILKNVTNIVELAVKVEKSNCTRLHSRTKLIEIKHMVRAGPQNATLMRNLTIV